MRFSSRVTDRVRRSRDQLYSIETERQTFVHARVCTKVVWSLSIAVSDDVIFKRYTLPVINYVSGSRTSLRPVRTTMANNPKICGTSSPIRPSYIRLNHCAYSTKFEHFPNMLDEGYGKDKNQKIIAIRKKSTDYLVVIRLPNCTQCITCNAIVLYLERG